MVTGVPVDTPVEAYASRSGGGRNTHAAPKDFGTRSSAGVRAESTSYSSSLHDSIVFDCTTQPYI
jgi:hypothetical protein